MASTWEGELDPQTGEIGRDPETGERHLQPTISAPFSPDDREILESAMKSRGPIKPFLDGIVAPIESEMGDCRKPRNRPRILEAIALLRRRLPKDLPPGWDLAMYAVFELGYEVCAGEARGWPIVEAARRHKASVCAGGKARWQPVLDARVELIPDVKRHLAKWKEQKEAGCEVRAEASYLAEKLRVSRSKAYRLIDLARRS